MQSNTFDRLSGYVLFLIIILLPIFCLPATSFSAEVSKSLLVVLGLSLVVIFWSISKFLHGKISIPMSKLLFAIGTIPLVFLISAIWNGGGNALLFGNMLDTGSFWFIFAAFALTFLSAVIIRTPKAAKTLLLGTILSSAILLIFQALHAFPFFANHLSLGILNGATGNLIGTWNSVGVFAGFSCLLYLLVVEFFPISRAELVFLEIMMLLAVLVAAAVNFALVWVLLGVSSLLIFVYKASVATQKRSEGEKIQFPINSFILVIISLLFFSSVYLSSFVPNALKLQNLDVSPDLKATAQVAKGVITKNPVLGIGPNRFGEAWAMYKPALINQGGFWDVSFQAGFGYLPTLLATSGILGILAILFFIGAYLWSGTQAVFKSIKNRANWEMVAFFILSLYLFFALFFYNPSSVIILIAFAFTGVFIGLSTGEEITFSFLNDHRKSFFSILVLILLVLFSVVVSFKFTERFASVPFFSRATTSTTIPEAELNIQKAIALYQSDLYLRTYAQIYLFKFNDLAQKPNLTDQDKADLQDSFNKAVAGAQSAVSYDPQNFTNYELLGSVYQSAGFLGVKNAYDNALAAYKIASTQNPLNPGIQLDMASTELLNSKLDDAKTFALKALDLKPNYTDAMVLLSKIYSEQGDSAKALSYANQALSLDPTNQTLIKYVNSLNAPTSTISQTNQKKK